MNIVLFERKDGCMRIPRVLGPVVVSAAAMLSPIADAQTLIVPKGFMWSPAIPPGFNYLNDPNIKPMVHINLAYNIYYNVPNETPGWFNPDQEPFKTGRWAANYSVTLGLQAGEVCVMIQNWARDDGACDSPQGVPEPDFNANMFRSADRILPEALEWEAYVDGGFPGPRTPNNSNGRTARYYRHCFLSNANANPNNPNVHPLRDWTRQFLLGYKHQMSLDPTIPRPDKFYFDSEPILQPHEGHNSVAMLRRLAENSTIWETWPVPGFNQTLKQMYDAKVADSAYNWPADAPNLPSGRGILHPTLGMIGDSHGYQVRNLSFQVWWSEICYRAQDEVMKFSGYDPIHDPNYGWADMNGNEYAVKVGNYHDFMADGGATLPNNQPERIGWFQDRPTNDNSLFYPRDYITTSVAREYLPRFSLHRVEGGYQFFGKGDQRFLGIRQWSSGQVDSPSLYAGKGGLLGDTQQKDYYLEGNPLNATQWDANRRNSRRLVETSINSNGGGKSHRMVPWLNMSGTDDSDPSNPNPNVDEGNYVTDYEFREMQMMLRGKNVPECLFYNRWWKQQEGETWEEYLQILEIGWSDTAQQLKNVYAGRIVNYVRGTGPMVSPGGGSYPYSPFDTARLEFTLADPNNLSVQEYDVEILPRTQILNGQYKYTTSLIVDIEWVDTDYINSSVADLSIESSVTTDGVLGEVFYWNGATWSPIIEDPSGPQNFYGFWAPQSSDGKYRSRQMFKGASINTFQDNQGRIITRLKLNHTVTKPQQTTVVSRYDLVQIAPIPPAEAGLTTMTSQPISDINTDGEVNTTDWSDFTEDWFNNQASADLNLNNMIDEGDVDTFVDSYINGT
jgi:hypothetical protein